MTYATLMNGGFKKALVEQRQKNPRSIWVPNTSCEMLDTPDIAHWLASYCSLERMFREGTSAALKPYIKNLLDYGEGNTDAAAVTLAIAEWTLPNNLWGGGLDVGRRRVLIGSGSLNQDIRGQGQVHAEHITTGVVVSALDDVRRHYVWNNATLTSLDVLIYTGKKKKNAVADFLPCGSCQITLKEVLLPLKDQIKNIWNLGVGIELV